MLNYDYTAAKAYCQHIGLKWFGDDYAGLVDADKNAKEYGLTQVQMDAVMRHHLWQVRVLFDPKNYKLKQRLLIGLYFLVGRKFR